VCTDGWKDGRKCKQNSIFASSLRSLGGYNNCSLSITLVPVVIFAYRTGLKGMEKMDSISNILKKGATRDGLFRAAIMVKTALIFATS